METDQLPEGSNKRLAADGAGDDAEAADRPAKKPRAEEEEQQLEAAEPTVADDGAAAAAALGQPQPLSESNEAAGTAHAAAGAADAAQREALPTTPSKAPAVAAAAAGASHDTKATPSPGPQHKPARLGDVVYRVLVPARAVSIVIGKQGCNVRELQSNSGARIQVGARINLPCCWP